MGHHTFTEDEVETAVIIEQLIETARQIREEAERGEKLGLSEADALTNNQSARKVMADEDLDRLTTSPSCGGKRSGPSGTSPGQAAAGGTDRPASARSVQRARWAHSALGGEWRSRGRGWWWRQERLREAETN